MPKSDSLKNLGKVTPLSIVVKNAVKKIFQLQGWSELSLLLIFLLSIYPYIRSGYYQDDAHNSLTYATFQLLQFAPFQQVQETYDSWVHSSGRFYPLGIFVGVYSWYYLFKNLLFYRVLLAASVFFNFVALRLFLRAMKIDSISIFLVGVIALICFQVRFEHDPITSYGLIYQISFLFGILSILCLVKFVNFGRRRLIIAGEVFFVLALLFFEINLIWLPILFAGVFFTERTRRAIQVLFATSLVGFIYLGLTFWIRHHSSIAYNGVQMRLTHELWGPFFNQMSGAFPFSYLLAEKLNRAFMPIFQTPSFLFNFLILGFLFSALIWIYLQAQLKKSGQKSSSKARVLLRVGFSLVIFPSFMIAMSSKYQEEIVAPGLAYLPVYFSYFGVGLILSTIFRKGVAVIVRLGLHRGASASSSPLVISGLIALSGVLGFSLSLNFHLNSQRILQLNQIWKTPRDLFLTSLRSGLFDDVPAGAHILFSNYSSYGNPGIGPALTYVETGKKLEFFELNHFDWNQWSQMRNSKNSLISVPTYILRIHSEKEDHPWMSLRRI